MWNEAAIVDEWFRAHYCFAGGVIRDWFREAGAPLEGASVLDFGCGDGIVDLSLALNCGPREVLGVDLYEAYRHLPQLAERQLGLAALPPNLRFRTIAEGQRLSADLEVDAIVSWSTFEHVQRPLLRGVLDDLSKMLKPGGCFFVQIEPLYFSPYGSHMQRFTAKPWAHLLDNDEQLLRIVRDHPLDFAEDQKDVMATVRDAQTIRDFLWESYLQLNRLTADELGDLLREAGFTIVKEARNQVTGLEVPRELLYRYRPEVLLTNEVALLARKGA